MGVELEFRGDGAEEHAVITSFANAGAKINAGDVIVRIHPQYYRPAEVDTLLGDATLARDNSVGRRRRAELVREMAAADLCSPQRLRARPARVTAAT